VADQVSQASPFGTTDTVISATRTKPVRERVAVDPEVALKAGLAVVGIVVLAAGYVMRTRTKRQLRKPTVRQKEAIAEPLSRILVRRLDMGRVAPDIVDLAEIAIGVDDYVSDGPIMQGPRVDIGVPEDLQGAE